MKTFDDIGVQIPRVFLPRENVDLSRWAVIACDQYTSQPDYWEKVIRFIGDSPSTYNLILPEIYLENADISDRIKKVQSAMHAYLDQGVLVPHEGMVYVERKVGEKTRKGIVIALDLECYNYQKGATSLIRATEGTIVSRLPPRMKIRQGAALELPHILVLIDDPLRTVIEPLADKTSALKKLYDFDLMLGSGHLTGYSISEDFEMQVINSFRGLAEPKVFTSKYGIPNDAPVFLFAMGDGNHSLATAKAIWEQNKSRVGMDHPSRYALVEVENVHDRALTFEPIHRVLFNVNTDLMTAMKFHYGKRLGFLPVQDRREFNQLMKESNGKKQRMGMIWEDKALGIIEISEPETNLAVGTLQVFLDSFMEKKGAEKIDYIHGTDVVFELGGKKGNAGFLVPGMEKTDLFKTVIVDGALPRKTFSMGEAWEKRFYMEARKII